MSKLNYRERIVYEDLKGMGYEVSQSTEKNYPDFRVFNFETNEKFYVEVKSNINGWDSQIKYYDQQKNTFNKLVNGGTLVLIAVPRNGVLEYKVYPVMSLWRKIVYGTGDYETPDMECQKCGYTWQKRKEIPVRCPNCKRSDYNK